MVVQKLTKITMRFLEFTAKRFLSLLGNRERGHNAIKQGFRFALHQKFPELGKDFLQSNNFQKVDKEVFCLEFIADFEGTLQEVVELLGNFFCGILVFEELSRTKEKKDLQGLLYTDLSVYATNQMLEKQIQSIKELI